jgi:long-chain acyl-CoA synthetase
MTLHPGTIAAQTPNKPAVICLQDVLTYATLDHDSRAIAAMLHANGLVQGDVIAMLVGNRTEFFSIAWAAQRSGLYYLPIPTRLTAPEITYILSDSGAKALFVDPVFARIADDATMTLNIGRYGIDTPASVFPDPPAIEGGDMLYTSGTTGRPKGVRRPLTGAVLGSDTKRADRASALFGLGGDSVFLSPAPLYHAAPLRFSMNLLRTGGTVVGMSKFDAAGALALIEQHRVTHSQWVPTMFNRLLSLPDMQRGSFDLSSHKVAIHAGAPCAADLKRRMINWWGPILHEYYSGTESVGFTHVTSSEWLDRPGTVGKAYGCAIHILDDQGNLAPTGEIGAVYFEGKAGLAYHNAFEKTQAAHNARGWATMGDIGYLDADGYLFLTDRRAFTIISGGVNIYPSEIEAVLSSHYLVRDVAVFGVADADLGESVFALVELDEKEVGDLALAQELIDHCATTLARFKLPRRIAFGLVGRSETGKIAKAHLREAYKCARSGFAISPARENNKIITPMPQNGAHNFL